MPETLEQIGRALLAAELDVPLHRHVREQRVVLEHEPDGSILRRQVDPASGVEPHVVIQRDASRLRSQEPGDRPQHGALARPGRAHQRERLARDEKAQLETVATEGNAEFDREDAHATSSLTPRRIVPLNTTSNAPIASAVSRFDSNWP